MDPVWEERYSSGKGQKYPWDSVVSFVFQNVPRDLSPESINILEVGFGTGANLWFAAREGFSVSGIEGSKSAVENAKDMFESHAYKADLRQGDFCNLPFKDNSFHLVIDRASLTHVGKSEQKKAIDDIYRVLKKGGKFMYNPYSTEHSSMKSGELESDGLTKNITKGTVAGFGQIAFISQEDINSFFDKDWKLNNIEIRKRIKVNESEENVHAEWLVFAEK